MADETERELRNLHARLAELEARPDAREGWFRRRLSSTLSIIAVVFSLISTGFSYLGTYQRNVHEAQTELRSLIVYMNEAAKRNVDILKSAGYSAAEKAAFSAALNKENLVYAAQAERVVSFLTNRNVELLFGRQISASELINIANNFYNSSLLDKSMEFYRAAIRYAGNHSEYVDAQRGYALLLAGQPVPSGSQEEWRTMWRGEFQKALRVFDLYPEPGEFMKLYTHALTEMAWATAELGAGECQPARQHMVSAKVYADKQHPSAKENTLWLTFLQQLEQTNLQIGASCRPTASGPQR
jgi:hypothetical protein